MEIEIIDLDTDDFPLPGFCEPTWKYTPEKIFANFDFQKFVTIDEVYYSSLLPKSAKIEFSCTPLKSTSAENGDIVFESIQVSLSVINNENEPEFQYEIITKLFLKVVVEPHQSQNSRQQYYVATFKTSGTVDNLHINLENKPVLCTLEDDPSMGWIEFRRG